MLVQRRRRWADVVQMLYKNFVYTGLQRKRWISNSDTGYKLADCLVSACRDFDSGQDLCEIQHGDPDDRCQSAQSLGRNAQSERGPFKVHN